MGMKQVIKSLDAFPRAEDHLLQKTQSGALVSVIGLIIMATLFVHELGYYLTTYTVHQMSVDLKRGETLPIHINMTFPSLPCDVLSVDAIDMSGKHEVDLDTNIWKRFIVGVTLLRFLVVLIAADYQSEVVVLRMNRDGHIIGTEYISDLVEKEHTHHKHVARVFSNASTLDSIILALTGLFQSLVPDLSFDGPSCLDAAPVPFLLFDDHKDHDEHSEQKIHLQNLDESTENIIKKVKEAIKNGEGCRVYGVLDVQRVAGNFHISVHGLNIYVAQMIFDGAKNVNVSHVIHDLSFGPKYPGLHNPLDDTNRILHDTSGTFKYYIKVVPTEYRYISKEVLPTNQFSVSEYYSPINQYDRTWPAVYFLYDLSPITVTIKEERRSFLHFITRLCAVLGGTFAVTGMLDRWMYRLIEALTKSKSKR
ncbi:hypothetical protein V8G54_032779 [Vigna mungo]|uniref:Endoplasmic reticulum-Golgi intermediate compartment protein 3 n=1 Tax=Vigna mungo TaxID=3915 RepID=A0AAQ3MLY6_VIGMU